MQKPKPVLAFVYGSLKRGGRLHDPRIFHTFCGETTIRGSMYSLRRFPAVVLDNGGDIHGEVYEIDERDLVWLDRIEGCPFLYQRKMVQAPDLGRKVWVYHVLPGGNRHTGPLTVRIESGRWEVTWPYFPGSV